LNELHVKLQLGVPMLQFFVGIPRRQDATHLAPHPLYGTGMSSAEIIFFYGGVRGLRMGYRG
jgi:hypothetical protein